MSSSTIVPIAVPAPKDTPGGSVVPVSVTVKVSSGSTSVSSTVDTRRVAVVAPAAIVNVPAVTALKSWPDVAVPPAVLQPSTVSLAAAPDCVTVNSTASPSSAEAADTDTVARIPSSVAQSNADVSLAVAAVSPSRLR